MLKFPVYLDNNATTACDPRVVEAMLPYFTERFGNAASHNHFFGWQAEEAVDHAREQVAGLIGAESKEIIFTSGATEADNLAIKGIVEAYASKGDHIITVSTEHKAVLDTCKHLEKSGATVTYLSVKSDGLIDLDELESSIQANTVLIAVMYANNETGIIQPIKQISDIARRRGILFFTDATQAVGKIPVNVNEDGIDVMAFSAHKIYGPKGVGALYVRRKNPRVKIIAQMDGGGHEKGMRSGTLNVPGIVGFGKACELSAHEMKNGSIQADTLRDKLEDALTGIDDVFVNGNTVHRLPHVSNVLFRYVSANNLMMRINKEIAVSSGSACTSALPEPSHVLRAMGLSDEDAQSSLRFAIGRFNTDEEIDFTIQKIKEAVMHLREMQAQVK
ncbi:MAG: IscS subfamily cysteine desulfurase [Bacteroidetes bacterium]|nr:IscS subfamily cysteine desulfurase [Bacteroidota bacterium]